MDHNDDAKRTYLSSKQVAEMLGVATGTLAAWRSSRSSGPPFYKLGRRVLYRLDQLEIWIETQKASNTVEAGQLQKRHITTQNGGL